MSHGPRPIVLAATTMHPAGMDLLRERTDLRMASALDFETLARELAPADGLVVRTAGTYDAKLMDRAPRLVVIGRHGVGYDQIDVEAATARGIQVVYTPGANAQAVCEHALAMMIGVSKHFARMTDALRAFRYDDRVKFVGRELFGRSLGVVGFGRIGRKVAAAAHRGLGMSVLYADVVAAPPEVERESNARRASFEEVLASSDYVTLHVPLDASTRRMINLESLALIKAGAVLVNTCRGPVVDERAVAAALDSGRLFGYAADVYEEEPPRPGHPLIGRPDVLLTPHSAAQTEESLVNMARWMAEDVVAVLEGRTPSRPVNDPEEVLRRRALRR